MHVCASALTAVRRIHANAASTMLRLVADNDDDKNNSKKKNKVLKH